MATHVGGSRTVRLGACVVAIGALAVAGCSGGSDGDAPPSSPTAAATTAPETTPSATPESPATPSPGATGTDAPTDPAGDPSEAPNAKWESVVIPQRSATLPDTDIEGAKAAAEGIWAAYFGGLIHGSTVNLEALSDTNCEFCKKSIAEIQYYESQGVRLDPSFTWNIEELLATGPAPDDDHHLVMLKFSYNPMKMVDSQGAVVSEGDAGVLYAGVRERLTPDGWSVAEVGDFSEEEYLGTRSQIFGDTP